MNRSGHKHDQLSKKQIKLIDLTRSTKKTQQNKPQFTKTRSKPKHLKHSKKQSSSKLKQLNQKHQDYFKISANNIYPSKQSSSIKANLSNDYCVNQYFVKSTKVKNTLDKKEIKSIHQQQQQDYFNEFKNPYNQQYGFDAYPQDRTKQNQSNKINNKISSMMKKISFSDKRALINHEGKIVSTSKQKTNKKSQLNKSNSQNTLSFSKQYLTKNGDIKKSKSKSKIKSRSKQTKLKDKQHSNSRNIKQKQTSRQHKLTFNNDKLTKVKSGQKFMKKEPVTINAKEIKEVPQKLYQTKYPNKQKHYNTESSQTIISKDNSHQPFYYYQRYPTSTTTLVDHSSTQSCSSSNSNLNAKQQNNYLIDFTQIAAQISSQIGINSMSLRKQKQIKLKGNFYLERIKCINLIANICGELRTKRQTFFLAIYYFDKYILNFQCSNMKGIALTSIMISLKMDIPELLPKYCLSFRPNPQATIKKTGKSHKKKKSQLSNSSSILKQKDSFLDTKDKLSLLITLPIYTTKDLYALQKQQDFHIGQIIQMQIQIMSRLKFKFYYKTHGYWIDLLTSAWDQYIGELIREEKSDEQNNDKSRLFFKRTLESATIKQHRDFKLFSYINQISQSTLTQIQSYKYTPITITLSIMYLLVRIQLQERKSLQPLTIYKYYRDNLSKSCNLIFCDSMGVNQLFSNFMSKISLNMAHIVQTIQFVAKFIVPEQFKIWNYKEFFGDNYIDRLANYQFNHNIFKINTIQ